MLLKPAQTYHTYIQACQSRTVNMHIHTYIRAYLKTHIFRFMYMCICKYNEKYSHTHVHTHMYTYMYMFYIAIVNMHTYTHRYINHIYICVNENNLVQVQRHNICLQEHLCERPVANKDLWQTGSKHK